MALCSVAVLAAGAPGLSAASGDLSDSQELVERAVLNQRTIALSHSLADERDDIVEFVAAGRSGRDGAGLSESQQARVDRQIAEVLATGTVPAPLKSSLNKVSDTRQQALTGSGSAHDTYETYSETLQQLQAVSRSVAQGLATDADPASDDGTAVATAEALPHLGRAVEQASATRGLLRGALAADGPGRELSEAAQLAHVREQAALADFEQTAGPTARETYDKTVTGTDVGLADRYLLRLTDSPELTSGDRALDRERVAATLSARVDRMRGVHSSLATAEVARLEKQRDDEVTALELCAALVGGCLLLAVGISVQTARSLARPLSVLRRGSQRLADDPATEEPVRFHGRDDEFADVVRALNRLRDTAAALHERADEAEADNSYLVRTKDELAAEREQLRREYATLRERLEAGRSAAHGTFVHLAVRTLGLVERQLGVIEALEDEEGDPDRLATLFKLDHLATRMRRNSENLLLLAGAEHGTTQHAGPVPLLDVLRAGISEIERYERVQLASLPPHAQVAGFAADDISHLVAELLDNATAFSAPDADVQLSGWMLENGEIMLSVQDEGIGVSTERLAELNARLGEPDEQGPPTEDPSGEPETGLGMGLYVVARLAARHGLRVQLREQKQGGIAAVVVVPRALLPDRPMPGAATPRHAAASGSLPTLPGSVAEANSNALPRRERAVAPGGTGTDTGTGTGAAAPGTAPGSGEAAEHGPAGPPPLPVRGDGGGDGAAAPHPGTADLAPAAGPAAEQDRPAPPARAAAADAVRPDTGAPPEEPAGGRPPAHSAPVAPHTDPHEHAGGAGPAGGRIRPEPETEDATGEAGEHPPAVSADPVGPAGSTGPADSAEPVRTDKGLPKRTPRNVAVSAAPAQPRKSGANAEELRRRLGGFQRGARDGLRDAEAEFHDSDAAPGQSAEDEEARR